MKSNLAPVRIVLGITGASGAIYAEQILHKLLTANIRTYVVFTSTAAKVIPLEIQNSLLHFLCTSRAQTRFHENAECLALCEQWNLNAENLAHLRVFSNDDLYAPIASGSEGATHMIVAPCSMGALARIAHGISSTLLERTADVMLKERRPLVIVPRETPFSAIHLQNMLTLCQANARIVPAMPAFYHLPKNINELVGFMVERILDGLALEQHWGQKNVQWNARNL